MASTTWHSFGTTTYALTGGSNIGVIIEGEQALMIDAGLDYDSARRAWRELEPRGARLAALLLTHGHADHFGGAGPVARRAEVPVYAPPLEGAFSQYPMLEPLYLYGGADPVAELRSKFTLAAEGSGPTLALTPGTMEVAGIVFEVVALPGHAPEQVGIAREGTCYCGDVVFPQATLKRHPILFCAHMDDWLATLAALPALPYARFVPGHGEPITDIKPPAAATADRLREIRDVVHAAIREPREPYDVLRAVAAHYDVVFKAPQFFWLSLTTIQAALTSLQRAGQAAIEMQDNHVLWHAV